MSTTDKCLLVLDDDVAVAKAIGFVAEALGFTVHCFDAPEPFFKGVDSLAPSHVALDLIMPGMDGVEVMRRLARQRCAAALIVTSGMGLKVLESAQITALERGLNIVGVLPKPFRSQLLKELLSRGSAPSSNAASVGASREPVEPRALADAIAARQIEFVVQPKLDVVDRVVVGAEVLARWTHPQLGVVPPDVFVALAESNGLMNPLTRLMLDKSLGWFSTSPLRAKGSLAVNLSTSCLTDVGLADQIQQACISAGVHEEQLVLEITESSAMDRTADTFDTLTRLRLKGFRLSIDDFGTGYSSLSQLARLPLSELKIDRSFVAKLNVSGDARKIVEATIRLAQSMDLVSVAEGVEDEEALQTLQSLGCNLAQGFLISRPLPGPEFDAWLLRFGTSWSA